jgi:ferredoxin-thioredoxin reductase catalytic subunit
MNTWKRFKPKNEEELRKNIGEYVKELEIKPNPDKKIVDWIIRGLLKNKEKYGEVYCPCRVVTGDKEKDKEIICPCSFHRKEIESNGHCKCLLFFKK